MFDNLSNRLGEVFDRLTRRGALSEADVESAMRDVRIALLEADVALPVVKDFVAAVKERAVGAEVLRSVAPGQMVIKIVHDRLVEMLGTDAAEIDLRVAPPAAILMIGLAGLGQNHNQRQACPPAHREGEENGCCSPRSTSIARRRTSSLPPWAARRRSTSSP